MFVAEHFLSNIAHRSASGFRHTISITARHRHLSVTESVVLPPDPEEAIMPSLQLKLTQDKTRYSFSQLLQLRRQMLRSARSLPRGSPERNDRRQIASSLRSLFRDKKWLGAHTVERP